MTPPHNFQLEHFFVRSLNIAYKAPASEEVEACQELIEFDYSVGTHNVEKNRFRLTFKTKIQEIAKDQSPVGIAFESEVVGFFSMNNEIEPPEKEKIIRINGVSMLYGILRGIVSTSSGSFECGAYMLPSINAAQVVQSIEMKKSKNNQALKSSNADTALPVTSVLD